MKSLISKKRLKKKEEEERRTKQSLDSPQTIEANKKKCGHGSHSLDRGAVEEKMIL